MEAIRRYGDAGDVYSAMLEQNPANSFAMKREVCVLLARGMVEEGTKALNRYLQSYQGDVVAWQQMAELQISLSNYGAAAFAYEELLLADPTNFLYHNGYAELLYSLGGCDNFRLARRYFSQSLEINRTNNARAALGLVMATFALAACYWAGGAAQADKSMTPREEREDVANVNARLQQAGGARLLAVYQADDASRMRVVLDPFLKRAGYVA